MKQDVLMTGHDIRKKFLDFFAERDHAIIESSPLVPHDDPTLLFTNAGMVQFKRVFMGEDKRDYVRATTSQRCVRAGGKHNDLENVGYTARHHTFFEMLGNFSFGDYFKEESIRYAWEFLTGVLGLPKDKLWVSVFEEDDEAYALWEKIEGLPDGKIIRLGEEDNFWSMGDTGPCGPCSEILIDQGPGIGCGKPDCRAGCDCDRYLELWNLVFMQFYRDETGKMTPLPRPSIDTGMGLERIAAVVQGVFSNYDSDLFSGIIGKIAGICGKVYGNSDADDTAMRVIADHSRATAFLVADGVLPSNEGRGYVLRRVMRRAVRYGRTLGLNRPFMKAVTAEVVKEMAEAYPHLNDSLGLLEKVVQHEEERFFETLDNGLAMLNEEVGRIKADDGSGCLSGGFIFKLYDTFGFPVDIVRDIALEEGFECDEAGYDRAMEAQRSQSKKSWKGADLEHMTAGLQALLNKGEKTRFAGYETLSVTSRISAMLSESGESISEGAAGENVMIVCPETPFYAEAGGQTGDIGEIAGPAGKARVVNTLSPVEGIVLHRAEITEGVLAVDAEIELLVADGRRQRIANNHTATHLLQAAMKQVLGDHVKQSGSLVEPSRLRFDFTHFSPLTPEEIRRIEQMVNGAIRADTGVTTVLMDKDEAKESGATALFGEKYDATVRVVSVNDFSKELCGGTHVRATGEIGLCKIVSETGIAAGVRRVEAITGGLALEKFQQAEAEIDGLADLLKTSSQELPARVSKLLARQKELEKEVSQLTARLTITDLDRLISEAKDVNGVRLVTAQIPLDSPKTLREVGDRIRDKMGTGVAVIGGVFQKKAALLAIVSKDMTSQYHAGKIIKEVASRVGGSGGGRPDMAQAGGPMTDKLPEALAAAPAIIADMG